MNEPVLPDEPPLRTRLNQETARIPWSELQRWFSSGMVIVVARDLDLIDVAEAVARDDTAAVRGWMQSGQVAKASDDQSRDWLEQDAEVWAVVIKPFILVQPE